ncbi:hypothetical protein [Candidatus Poriferisodalis sp.]|uniref:hypothetical protein n=1 Tax=Candidatus Poriferisodalis sp. TaxID=3101277 RepID=UPI003B02A9C9
MESLTEHGAVAAVAGGAFFTIGWIVKKFTGRIADELKQLRRDINDLEKQTIKTTAELRVRRQSDE